MLTDESQPRRGAPAQNANGHHNRQSPTPLADLRAQGAGLGYVWLPDPAGGCWQAIILPTGLADPALAATRYPRLRLPQEALPATGAAPRLEHSQPDLVAQTAALVDGAGISQKRVARLLHPHPDDDFAWVAKAKLEPSPQRREAIWARENRWKKAREAAVGKVRDHLRAGRRLLHARRVLPWAMWADGRVPAGWWESEEFEEAIGWWREHAVRFPVEPEPATAWEKLHTSHRDIEARQAADARAAMPTWARAMLDDPLPRILAVGQRKERLDAEVALVRAQPWRFDAEARRVRAA